LQCEIWNHNKHFTFHYFQIHWFLFIYLHLVRLSLYSPGWPWTLNAPSWASQVLGYSHEPPCPAYLVLWIDLLSIHDFVTPAVAHLEKDLCKSPKCWHILLPNIFKNHFLAPPTLSEKSFGIDKGEKFTLLIYMSFPKFFVTWNSNCYHW
jgi:hypothetical protein